MAFLPYSDEQHKFCYAREATFGTPIALDQAFKGLTVQRGEFVDLGINKSNLDQNRVSRILAIEDLYHDNYSGPILYRFSTILTKGRAADLLYLVCQNRVSQGGSTAYAKIFRMHATQPDFSANAGCFVTGIWNSPIAAKDIRLTSGILRSLTITWDKEGTGVSNLVKASGEFIFQKYEVDQTYTGTVTEMDITTAWEAHDFTVGLLTTGVGTLTPTNWAKASVTIANNATALDKNSSGLPANYFLNPGDGMKCSAEFWYTTAYLGLLADYATGGNVILSIGVGSVGTDPNLGFTISGKIINTPLASANGQMRIPIELQVGNVTAAGTNACDVSISDSVSQT
jgi:hypothetical protein